MKNYILKSLSNLFLVGISFLWVVPLYSLFITSFKTISEISKSPTALPKIWSLRFYLESWTRGNLSKFFLNSAKVSISAVIIVVFFSSLAAYGITKAKFSGYRFFYFFFIAGLFIPAQILIIPLFHLMSKTHLLNTFYGVALLYAAYALPFCVFLFCGFFKGVPEEIIAAAKIDGCSEFGIYLKIIMPLSKPVIATVVILQFMWFWNEYVFALVFLNKSNVKTLPLALAQFEAAYVANFSCLASGIIISIIPIVVTYILFQKYFIRGLTEGAVK
jgi:ABC-type glycerol-3-phosphate transport system permease component